MMTRAQKAMRVLTGECYCTRCGVLHARKHQWCRDCFNAWIDNGRRVGDLHAPGHPPPPPPGFDVADLENGRPLL